jgi:FtsP/CotA-like multicopper oxidase with cupredoxin domain
LLRASALPPEPFNYDREHIVMLTDWTDESPERVFAKLKKQSVATTAFSGPSAIFCAMFVRGA